MLFGRSLMYVVITACLFSCWAGKQLPAPAYLDQPIPVDSGYIRFDGFYTTIQDPGSSREKYTAVNPVYFINKNKVYVVHGANTDKDSTLFTGKYYQQLKPTDFGGYIIKGNKISAFAPVAVAIAGGTFYFVYNLHFAGTIVDENLITDWKAVPPFPKRIKKNDIEEPQNNGIFKAHDLKFIPVDSLTRLNP